MTAKWLETDFKVEFARLEDICSGKITMHGEFSLDWDANGTEGRARNHCVVGTSATALVITG